MNLTPRTERFGVGNLTWLGSRHGSNNAQTGTLKVADFQAIINEHGFIPAGVPLKQGENGLYSPVTAAEDKLAGFLFTDQAGNGDKEVAPILWHGRIIAANLPKGSFDVTKLSTPNPAFTIVKPSTSANEES